MVDNTSFHLEKTTDHDVKKFLTLSDVFHFKLKSGKTEIVLFGTKQKLKLVDIPSLSVAGTKLIISDSPIRNLSAMFDSSLSVTAQTNNKVKTANIQTISSIIGYLSSGLL